MSKSKSKAGLFWISFSLLRNSLNRQYLKIKYAVFVEVYNRAKGKHRVVVVECTGYVDKGRSKVVRRPKVVAIEGPTDGEI